MTTPIHELYKSDPALAWLADPEIRKCHSYSAGVFWKDENLKRYFLSSAEFAVLVKGVHARVEAGGADFNTELRVALYRDDRRQKAAEAAALAAQAQEEQAQEDQAQEEQAQEEQAGAAEADAHPAATGAPDGAASLAPLPPSGEPEGEPSNPDLAGEVEQTPLPPAGGVGGGLSGTDVAGPPAVDPWDQSAVDPADQLRFRQAQDERALNDSSAPEDPAIPLGRSSEMDLAQGKPRHNQWSRRKMVLFLRELAASQSVSQAARSVGMSRQSAYKLRTRLNGTPFALGWELALEAGIQQLAHAVMDRALNGEEVPHYHRGELVGTSRRHDNHLARWVLENPWKLGRMQIAREYAADGFDKLLERIEWEPLDWQEGEPLPGQTLALPELDEDGEPLQPDYEDEDEEPGKPGPDGQAVPRVWTEEERFAAAKRKDVDDFLRQRSWYISDSRRRASERPGRREPQTRARR